MKGTRSVRGLPDFGRCGVIGVVNVTPDSFSDGGEHYDAADAIRHGLELHAAGVDLVDVGGESTRPGAARVDADEELRRVLPVVRELAAAGALVSVDTTRVRVAAAALEAGAAMVNDVSGGLADPEMFALAASAKVPYVLMHWRGHSSSMMERAVYADVVDEVVAELRQRFDAAVDAGMDPEQIVLDPGLGFAKTGEHNWQLLRRFDELLALGRPVLVAASRKAFLGRLLATPDGAPRPPRGRDIATAALSALMASAGAWAVRVHDAVDTMDAVIVAAAMTGDPEQIGGRMGGQRGGQR